MIPALLPLHKRAPLAFERGEGCYLFDASGRRYLDFICGIGVTGFGHAHPHLVAALTEQVRKVWHVSNLYQIPSQQRLAERLVAATFADSVFFFNSGAEAIECSIKMVRKHHDATGRPERFRIITFEGAFHGRTLAAVSAGGQPKHLDGFEPAVEGFDKVPFEDLGAVKRAITRETAAILVEPIQGEGGIRPANEAFLKGLRAVADEAGLLLVVDEVQCGMGRSGKLFAFEWAGIEPDIAAIAKALGGGFPIGACLAKEGPASAMTVGSHGSTFGGNPLATTVGNAVLDILLAEGFLENVVEKGALLRQALDGLVARHPKVVSGLQGRGLMLGLPCVVPNGEAMAALREAGLLTGTAGSNVLRLLPPLIVGPAEIEEAAAIMDRVFGKLAR